jgi:hypothetical protein
MTKAKQIDRILDYIREFGSITQQLTIDDILEIARQIDKETGRYLSYGDVCTGIYAGRINPDDYLEKRRRTHDKRRVERGVIEQATCCGDNE